MTSTATSTASTSSPVNSHIISIANASNPSPRRTILWEDHDKFLAQTRNGDRRGGFHETGLARFAAFDLQFLLTDHRYYLYSDT